MGAAHTSASNEQASDYRLVTFSGENFLYDGKIVKLRMDDYGFSLGCTKISWETYRSLKSILAAGE